MRRLRVIVADFRYGLYRALFYGDDLFAIYRARRLWWLL